MNKEFSARTTDDSSTNADGNSVSPTCPKPNVVGSLFSQREIKFRAWLIPNDDFESEMPYMTYDLAFEEYAPVNEQLQSVLTLMQFTGLKDKTGKEIYEGDIVSNRNNDLRIVIFKDGCFQMCLTNGSKDISGCIWYYEVEVVGNIFETPQLLETVR